MAALSNYLVNKTLDSILRGQAFITVPTTVYVALYTSNPTAVSGSGTEVTGGSYARVAITTGLTAFTATQGGTAGVSTGTTGNTTNAATITFPAPTAAWGVITGMSVYDAATGGNELVFAPLSTSKTVNSGDPAPSFAVSALSLTLA